MSITKRSYRGWQNNYELSNGAIELIVTADVGPRVISCGFPGGRNLFKNYDSAMGRSGEDHWENRGGHRLWVAPEDHATTYTLDNSPISITETAEGLIATQPVDPDTRLEKQIEIRLPLSGAEATLLHRIRNHNRFAVPFAPWALTVMAPGGVAVAPLPPRARHEDRLLPTNPLVMWGYTDFSDPRWKFLPRHILLRQDPAAATPQKAGLFAERTRLAYQLNGDVFLKTSTADPSSAYPDMGASCEFFTNGEMLELETLGPLETVAPGGFVEHIEHWSLHRAPSFLAMSDDELHAWFESR
jgi:hypothetical protein